MTTNTFKALYEVAQMNLLTFEEAAILPTAVTNAASKVNMSEEDFAVSLIGNADLRNYLASACRKIAAANAAETAVEEEEAAKVPELDKIEVGATYSTSSACDSECIYSVTIVSRTAKTAMVDLGNMGGVKRCKIHSYNGREYVMAYGKYSMAPSFGPR